jgi:signal transduction histidine kinase
MQGISQNIVIILGASAFLLLVTLFIVFLLMAYKKRDNAYLNERKKLEDDFNHQILQSRIEVQEQTFQQIGKELHDNVGQLLSTTRMLIGLTERNLKDPPDTLLTANTTLGNAINEIRSLSKSLDKEWLDRFDFENNLKTEIARINLSNVINAALHCECDMQLPAGKKIILFRIVQEAIQNAVKHSECRNLSISFFKRNGIINILIEDDGKGFYENYVNEGLGLSNMQHRTILLHGNIKMDSATDKGTKIIIQIPENE